MARILLVEDDDLLRPMLRETLERTGHAVVEARNGKEALEQFRRQPVDLILTDLIMPEQEGLEIIQELRRNHPAVKIIAMSGGGRIKAKDYLHIAAQMGAQHTLAKPFSNEDLTHALDAVLPKPDGIKT